MGFGNDGTNTTFSVPMVPMYGNYGGNGGDMFGMGGGMGAWWLLVLLFAIGGWGNNRGGNNDILPYLLMNNNNNGGGSDCYCGGQIQRGFDQQAIISGINGGYSGHSVDDMMIQSLERTIAPDMSEVEKQRIYKQIRMIRERKD